MDWRSDSGLAGRSVVVTGAAGGIGRSVARAFAEAGSHVVAVDVPGSPVASVVEGLPGGPHRALELDLLDLDAHAGVFAAANELAPFRALAHLAAVLRRNSSIDDVTEEDWDAQLDVNLKATFFLARAASRALRDADTPGAIVTFSSQGWWTGGFGGSVVYNASKGGVATLTKGLARSLAPHGIRVNAVAPGGVDTAMMREGMSEEAMASFLSMIPLGRLARTDELAGAVLFLASDASSFVTGSIINVSGGQLMY
ncbi:SDR family NAD(P)-dependent oxidoreductase [Salinibacterium soli]|uniref:SDR family NAD(P)-dependent oxidoreductase n=1 Tax=Antiquaquibacter soli TaxID=3064523 RepID=A0ABT9BKM3_9MICO|nr:SDR family NAD(P)-dependent oxidoreductase [Protaetiibacter sp. WY-16]MDO7881569.1 SDR family NAD(P)-dependent oxidoreductase [Protaetiibacter sp. WY-16]